MASDATLVDIGIAVNTGVDPIYETEAAEGSRTFEQVLFTGEGLTTPTETADSESISSDGMSSRPIVTKVTGDVSLPYEFSHSPQTQILLPMALSTTGDNTAWNGELNHLLSTNGATAVTAGAAGDNVNNYFRVTTADISTELADIRPGQWIWVSGMVNAANNGFFKVWNVNINDTEPGFDHIYVTSLLTAEASPSLTATFVTSYIRNEMKQRTILLFQDYTGLEVPLSILAHGCRVNDFTVEISAYSKVTATCALLATYLEYKEGSGAANTWRSSGAPGNTYNVAPTRTMMNASLDATKIMGYSDIDDTGTVTAEFSCVTSATISFTGRARELDCIGTINRGDTGLNRCIPEISLTRYFSHPDQWKRIFDIATNTFKPEWLDIFVSDGEGRYYAFTFPDVVWSGDLPGPALDDSLMLDLTGKASRYYHPVDVLAGSPVAWAAQVCSFDTNLTPTAV